MKQTIIYRIKNKRTPYTKYEYIDGDEEGQDPDDNWQAKARRLQVRRWRKIKNGLM